MEPRFKTAVVLNSAASDLGLDVISDGYSYLYVAVSEDHLMPQDYSVLAQIWDDEADEVFDNWGRP